MKIEQLMSKEVSTCAPDDTLNEAARIMWERDCGMVPVVSAGEPRRVVGVITDRDVCMAGYTKGRPLAQIRIADVMSTRVASCPAGADVREAERTMRAAQVHRLPVVDNADQLLGVISLTDIARALTREAASRRKDVTAGEIGETLAAIRKPRELGA